MSGNQLLRFWNSCCFRRSTVGLPCLNAGAEDGFRGLPRLGAAGDRWRCRRPRTLTFFHQPTGHLAERLISKFLDCCILEVGWIECQLPGSSTSTWGSFSGRAYLHRAVSIESAGESSGRPTARHSHSGTGAKALGLQRQLLVAVLQLSLLDLKTMKPNSL